MGLQERTDAAADKVAGKAKEVTGSVTDNDKLEAEGKVDQVIGKAKDAFEDVKDKIEDGVNDLKNKLK